MLYRTKDDETRGTVTDMNSTKNQSNADTNTTSMQLVRQQ